MEKEITGKVTGVAKQWWLKVNTKPIRLKFMDGAVFPHIIKVVYSVDGKEYTKRKWLSKLCSGYIFFFRGTPLLMQLLVIYFTVPGIFGFTWRGLFKGLEAVNQGAFVAAFITFSLNSGAYCAEIVRAAIQSIDKGQNEAAKALGMNYSQTMTKIIIPQAVRRMIPPVCNEFIMILKDVSIVFAIGLADITQISNSIVAANAGDYLVFVPAVIIYLIITAVFSKLFEYIEKKYSVYE